MAPSQRQSPDLLFASFNQDFSCVSVGTKKGYQIINTDPFGRVYSKNEGAVGIVEMLFCTSLVALVGAADQPKESPRRLHIVNTKRESTICELLFPTSILSVKLNRKRMVVVLEEEIYIYDVSTMKLLHTIDTSVNPEAICALSPSSENSYLAYPSPIPSPTSPLTQPSPLHNASTSSPIPASTTGDVLLFDTLTLAASNVIRAHKSPIAFLSLNSSGTLLATSSDKGTVIRVFSVPGAEKVAQFRRGSYSARIFSINFNLMSTLLAVSSDSDTIHIFKIPKSSSASSTSSSFLPTSSSSASSTPNGSSFSATTSTNASSPSDRPPSPSSSSSSSTQAPPTSSSSSSGSVLSASASLKRRSMHLTRNLAGSVGGYLPSGLTEMWDPQRDFAHVKLRGAGGIRCVAAMSGTTPQIYVLSSAGLFHVYNIDLERGGECLLLREFSILTDHEQDV